MSPAKSRPVPPFQPLEASTTNGSHYPGDALWSHNLDARVVLITPALAKEWLTHNIGNRHEKPAKIDQYKRDMQHGRWDLTGEPIIFDSDGHLRNGQNRLRACVIGGSSFRTVVIWGIHPEGFRNMDRGAGRTAADVLGIQNEDYAPILAAACGYIGKEERGVSLTQGGKSAATVDEIFDVLERHPSLRNSLEWQSTGRHVGIEPSLAVYLHYKLSRIDADDAAQFFSSLSTGAELAEGDPVLLLRNTFMAAKAERKQRLLVAWKVAYTIKAWNAWRAGKSIKLLRWNPSTEDFPVPV